MKKRMGLRVRSSFGALMGALRINRFVRFGAIGAVCMFLVQLPLLWFLTKVGFYALAANTVGFVVSGLANYELQRRLTFSRTEGKWRTGLLKFQLTSLVSLGVNTVVFAWLHHVWHWQLFASAVVAGVFGSGLNFLVSRSFTFRASAQSEVQEAGIVVIEDEIRPELHEVQLALMGETLVHFMPAHNEEYNLRIVVKALRDYFSLLGLLEYKIIIVNDGSDDRTGQIANTLATAYSEVEVIHHDGNQGYGAAMRTGFTAAVNSGFGYWCFSDSDRQFAPESLGTALFGLAADGTDMVVGYRIGRKDADSPFRYWLGRLWHFVSKAFVGRENGQHLLSVRDVDCGLKVGRVKKLAQIAHLFRGEGAAISPELVAWANLFGHKIAEVGVAHLPRLAGESSGSDLRVMIRSAWHIGLLGLRLRRRWLWWLPNPLQSAKTN